MKKIGKFIKNILCIVLALIMLIPCLPIYSIAASQKFDQKMQRNMKNYAGVAFDDENLYYSEVVETFYQNEPEEYDSNRLIQKNLATGEEKVIIDNTPISRFTVYDGYVYYHFWADASIYRLKIGTNRIETVYDDIYEGNFLICNSKIVLSTWGQDQFEKVLIMNLDGSGVIEPNIGEVYDFYLMGDKVVFQNGSACYELNLNTGKAKLLFELEDSTLNLFGASSQYLYYSNYNYWSYFDNIGTKVFRYDLNKKKLESLYIYSEAAYEPFVIDDILFLYDSKEDNVYNLYYIENGSKVNS